MPYQCITCFNATEKRNPLHIHLKMGIRSLSVLKAVFLLSKNKGLLFQLRSQPPNICKCFIKLTDIWATAAKLKCNGSSRFRQFSCNLQ